MKTGIIRGLEEFRLPKFVLGSELSDANLVNYRSILAGPKGRGSRLITRLQKNDAIHEYVEGDRQEPPTQTRGFIGAVLFGRRGYLAQYGDNETPVVLAAKYRHGEVLEVMTDNRFVIRAIRLSHCKQEADSDAVLSYWEEVQFPSNQSIETRTINQPSPEVPVMDVLVMDRVAEAVKLAERKPFL